MATKVDVQESNTSFLTDYYDLIEYNFQTNARDKSIYSLIGMLNIEVDDEPLGTVQEYVKMSNMSEAFEIYGNSESFDVNNLLDQNYIKFAKLIHEHIEKDMKELKILLSKIHSICVKEIKDKLRIILTTNNPLICIFDRSKKTKNHSDTRIIRKVSFWKRDVKSGFFYQFQKKDA